MTATLDSPSHPRQNAHLVPDIVSLAVGHSARQPASQVQTVLLGLITSTTGARTVIEIGTRTGRSTLAMAQCLPEGGTVHTFDVSTERAEAADRTWREAGLADRIRQHIGPAAQLLASWPVTSPADLAFIDASRVGCAGYWDLLVPRMADNALVLVGGAAEGDESVPPEMPGVRGDFDDLVRSDDRVEVVRLPLPEGLVLARKVARPAHRFDGRHRPAAPVNA